MPTMYRTAQTRVSSSSVAKVHPKRRMNLGAPDFLLTRLSLTNHYSTLPIAATTQVGFLSR